jgi:hypothetical protein
LNTRRRFIFDKRPRTRKKTRYIEGGRVHEKPIFNDFELRRRLVLADRAADIKRLEKRAGQTQAAIVNDFIENTVWGLLDLRRFVGGHGTPDERHNELRLLLRGSYHTSGTC